MQARDPKNIVNCTWTNLKQTSTKSEGFFIA